MKIRRLIDHGKKYFVLDWYEGSIRRRLSYSTLEQAEKEKAKKQKEMVALGRVLTQIPAEDRIEIGRLWIDAKREAFTLRQAIDFFRAHRQMPIRPKMLSEAFSSFMAEKEAARLSRKTLGALRSNVGRFVSLYPAQYLHQLRREDVMRWLQPSWAPRTFNSYLISLHTFFRWCVATELILKSPTATIRKIGRRQMPDLDKPPQILSSADARRLLKAGLKLDSGLIPYIATGLFAGLRPQKEAARLAWEDIGQNILVRGQHAKDRQRRYVEIHPTLRTWLELGGDLPVKNLRRRFERAREAAGLIRIERTEGSKKIYKTGWSQDCLRHSFASHYLPLFGVEKTIQQLGHGDYSMLFSHYRQLVSISEAKAYWALKP